MTSPQINNDGTSPDFWLFVAVATSIGILVMLVWEAARRADEFDWPEETTGSRALRDVRKQIESERNGINDNTN